MKICDKDGNTPRALAMQYEFYECVDILDELTSEFTCNYTTRRLNIWALRRYRLIQPPVCG